MTFAQAAEMQSALERIERLLIMLAEHAGCYDVPPEERPTEVADD